VRICIFGAGASGGHFAVRLAEAGHDVGVIARGSNLAAIQEHGLTLEVGDTLIHARPQAASDASGFGVQDLVIVTVKANTLVSVPDAIAPLIDDKTFVAFPQNGMSWWYPQGLPADKPPPPRLPLFELAGAFGKLLSPERILGGSIYSANEMTAPGIVRNTSPGRNALHLGSVSGSVSPGAEAEVAAIRAMLEAAGLASPDPGDIRQGVWLKLLINMSGSAIALASENKSSIARHDPALGDIYLRVLREGLAIAAAHGYPLDRYIDPQAMLAKTIDHKPSLLQDFERGRPMELAEIIEAPAAFARAAGLDTPVLDTLAAITIRRARDRGLY